MTWEPIEEQKAKKRRGMRNDMTSVKIFTDVASGKAIDAIARRIGLGSGDTCVTLHKKLKSAYSQGKKLTLGQYCPRVDQHIKRSRQAINIIPKSQGGPRFGSKLGKLPNLRPLMCLGDV